MPASTADEEKAIVDAVVRCAAAFDRRDWNALDEVFTADATAYGVHGRDAIVRFVRDFLGGCGPSQHLLGNHHVVLDGDRERSAKSVCKARVLHVGAGEKSHLSYECLGNYWDDLVLTDSGWRIVNRTFEVTISLGDISVLQPG
jgi:SnoaL-like protein